LTKTFGLDKAPVKSAFSAARAAIHWRFVEDTFCNFIAEFESYRPVYQGLRVYAIDGQQLSLPMTKDISGAGFCGRALPDERESYMPKAYITHAYDVLSGTSKNITLQNEHTELVDALGFVDSLEKNSLTIYDRLYFSQALYRAHFKRDNFFLMRCQSNANAEISAFFADPNATKSSMKVALTEDGEEKTIWFIKVDNDNDGSFSVFATNLPRRFRNAGLIDKLYRLRWEVENSFREFTDILKLEQWHSKTINGIRQELYALLLLINLTKITMFFAMGQRPLNPENDDYQKPNFKLIFDHVVSVIGEVFRKLSRLTHAVFRLVMRSLEKRKRRSRSYPRHIRSPASLFHFCNYVPSITE
jgi:hypothetical protein